MTYQEEHQEGMNPERDTVVPEGIHVNILVGEIRTTENEKRMVYMEKLRMEIVGKD